MYTREQANAGNTSHREATTNSKYIAELSDCSGSLPSMSITNSQATMEANSTILLLPDPPTHEPGEKSKNKAKGKRVKDKMKKMFSSKK